MHSYAERDFVGLQTIGGPVTESLHMSPEATGNASNLDDMLLKLPESLEGTPGTGRRTTTVDGDRLSPFGQFFAAAENDDTGMAWKDISRKRAVSGNRSDLEQDTAFVKVTPSNRIRASTTVISPASKRKTETELGETLKLKTNPTSHGEGPDNQTNQTHTSVPPSKRVIITNNDVPHGSPTPKDSTE